MPHNAQTPLGRHGYEAGEGLEGLEAGERKRKGQLSPPELQPLPSEKGREEEQSALSGSPSFCEGGEEERWCWPLQVGKEEGGLQRRREETILREGEDGAGLLPPPKASMIALLLLLLLPPFPQAENRTLGPLPQVQRPA